MALTYYQILGVDSRAGFAELRRAYYRQAKRCHPDLFRNAPDKTREFQALALAFDTLSDAEKRRRYDRSLLTDTELIRRDRTRPEEPMMDSEADDILEELIVGNRTPPESSLATLLADLRKTEIFMTYREGRDHFRHNRFENAETCFAQVVAAAPQNIVFRINLARTLAARKKFGAAARHYRAAIGIGKRRVPCQRLLRVRRELEEIERRRLSLFGFFRRLFHETPAQLGPDEADLMIDELNRSLTRAARNLQLENRDEK
ncbi:J domain-containing protein [uncultured Victivallis sp.]|uniref:J domain-containing protein n=1 Tax=uncultured Victivallis sp. TaxID=354118 RepID=UPI0025E556DF|nr:J domain-containing protein [uncultured Victivallis sp.]